MKKGEFLLSIRKKHKASRAKFAKLLEVSPSSIEKAEKEIIPVTPENKYVKAVCALEGLDNEIFKFDEITEEILKEYELTKFSKAFRKFLFFYYGDFWNKDIENEFYNDLLKFLKPFLKDNAYKQLEYIYHSIKEIVISERDLILQLIFYTDFIISFFLIPKKRINNIIENKNEIEKNEIKSIIFLNQVLIIAFINSLFNECISLENFIDKFECSMFTNKLTSIDLLLKTDLLSNDKKEKPFDVKEILYIEKLKNFFLNKIKCNGLPLTIENIRKLKKQKELENIKDEIQPSPTDPKDKEICELLQYAPPAFKDKIIEKLKKFRDEVEDI